LYDNAILARPLLLLFLLTWKNIRAPIKAKPTTPKATPTPAVAPADSPEDAGTDENAEAEFVGLAVTIFVEVVKADDEDDEDVLIAFVPAV
jgi:hypothetical protein